MTSEENLMNEALKEARLAFNKGEVPIGAVVEMNGEIIGRGHNLRETYNDPTAHAEILALRAAAHAHGDWRLTGATLYVTIEPCVMCTGAAQQSRIAHIVYGSADPKGGAVESLYQIHLDERLNHIMKVTGGVLEEACRQIVKDFFKQLRNKER
jgi:tRNA(adenine34) deaminase